MKNKHHNSLQLREMFRRIQEWLPTIPNSYILHSNILHFKKLFLSIFLIFFTLSVFAIISDTTKPKTFFFRGYVKEMPSLQFDRDFQNTSFSNILHNRLNFRWQAQPSLAAVFEVRNRLISSEIIDNGALIKTFFETDNGFVDASYVPFHDGKHLLHVMSDRFYLDWQHGKWQVRAGRQRINWGINMVSNPNDLFNTYNFFDFDYEERPGADALRVQYFTGDLSRLEIAVNPAKETKESVAALMYAFNKKMYDFQFIGGYYKNRLALGGGWAGQLKGMGFKGEMTLFNDIEKEQDVEPFNFVFATSFDYMFDNSLYALIEFLYNGGHERKLSQGVGIMLTEPMAADNILFSAYALTGTLMYPFSPVLSGSLSGMYLPDMEAYFVSPNITYSVITNLDASFVAQYFAGKANTVFAQGGLAAYLQLKWSF